MKKTAFTSLLLVALAGLMAVGCEPGRRSIEPGASPSSGAIAMSSDDSQIVIAAEDHNALLVLDRESRTLLSTIAVPDGPSHVVVAGNRAIVTSRYDNSVSLVDLSTATLIRTIAVGSEPLGLASLGGGRVAIALGGDAAVAIVDVDAGQVEKTIELGNADPRAVARLKDGSLYITHLSAGVLSRVNLETGVVRTVDAATQNDFGPRLIPEHLRSVTVDPATNTVLMAHSQANVDTVRAPIGEVGDIDGDEFFPGEGGGECGYSGCPTQLGAVVPGVTEVDPDGDVVIVPEHEDTAVNQRGNCFDCEFDAVAPGGFFGVAAPPSVLNPFESRFNGLQLSNPTALALFDGGRGEIIVNMGSKNALLLRRQLKGNAADVVGVVKLGNGAQAIAVSRDGRDAYVWNQFDGSVTEIELPQLTDVTNNSRFEEEKPQDGAADVAFIGEEPSFGLVPELVAATNVVIADALDVEISAGRKLFHDATDTRIAASGSISCASCHPDGRTDGRTWQFTFGPRNTPQLGGGILDTAPFHWPGDVPTVTALNEMTVRPFMGGEGLDDASFQKVAAFINTIKAAPAATVSRELTAQEIHGKEIFESAETGCTACHAGHHFTDNGSYDIGTKADERDIRSFQTPVLHGLARSAPYLHDGSAKSLSALVDQVVRNDQMGVGSHLSDADADALVAYLKTL